MNSQQFDDIIKQKAQQREADVPQDIWEGISRKKKKKRFPFFWFILLALLLAGGGIVWKINNKIIPANAVAIEKTGNENNNTEGKTKVNEKNTEEITTSVISSNIKKESDAINTNKINTPAGKQSFSYQKDNYTTTTLNQSSNTQHKKNEIVSAEFKEQSKSSVNKTTDTGEITIFTANRKTYTTKSKRKTTVIVGETDDLIHSVASQEKILSVIQNDQKNKEVAKINIAGAETDNVLDKPLTNNTDAIQKDETGQPLKIANPDSLVIQKTLLHISDSISIAKKETANTTLKKSKKEIKKYRLKIETGFTAISPIQEYKQPLYVKRVINGTAIHSEFISNNIKSNIEPGAAISINLIKSMTKKWSAGAGLRYLRITERLHFSGIETNTNFTIVQRLVTDPNGSYLKADTISVVSIDTTTLNGRNIYNSFSIPLFVRYQLATQKKWSCSFTAGIYINVLTTYNDSLPGKFENIYSSGNASGNSTKSIGLDIFTGLHFSGILGKRYEWFAEPGFSYNLANTRTNNLSFNKKIHKPGISLGIVYRFK